MGSTPEAEFVALGKMTTPDGAIVETLYSLTTSGSQIGSVATVKDQTLKERRSVTNAMGQLKRVDEPNSSNQLGTVTAPNQDTRYDYDLLNNLTLVTQGAQTRNFTYDAMSRLKSAANPESGTINYTYDANSNLATKIDARNITTTFSYDTLNRVSTRSYNDGSTPQVSYFYDNLTNAKGKLIKSTSSVSTTESTAFDILGRVTAHKQTTDGTAYTTGYVYNLSGGLAEETYPSGRVVKNILDGSGDLSMVESKKNAASGFWSYANSFTYNAAGAVTSMQLGNGHWEKTTFNNRLQPTQIGLGVTPSATDLLKLDYTYGTIANNGNILSQTITVPTVGQSSGFTAVQNYTYDSLNRLDDSNETISGTQTWRQDFTYDRFGNRNFVVPNTTTLGSCPTAQCNPTINPANNRFNTGQGYSYDSAGNTTADAQGRTFVYDAENKQTSVLEAGGTIGQYFYDGDGKRVKKYVPASGETTIFVYDAASKLVAEYSTNVEPTATAEVAYLTNDHLGSPRINTDRDGAVTSRHDYHPFGKEIDGTGGRTTGLNYGDDTVRKQFTGYERDNESGLDFAQARYVGSTLGRFMSVDPIKMSLNRILDPQQINLYAYSKNNPLKYIDTEGRDIQLAAGLTKADADRIVKILAKQYMSPSGRKSLEQLERSDITYRYGTGSLGQVEDAQGNVVGEKYATVIPEPNSFKQNVTVDANKNPTALDREGLVILITFDFQKMGTIPPTLPNGDSASDQQIANHELGHEMDADNLGPLHNETADSSTTENSAEAFRGVLDNETPYGVTQADSEARVRDMLALPNSPGPAQMTCGNSRTANGAACMNEVLKNEAPN